jgi:hypothetical protein
MRRSRPISAYYSGSVSNDEMATPKPKFRTRENGMTMGARTRRELGTTAVEKWCSLFSDDCALFFNSRVDIETAVSYLNEHLLALGIKLHFSTGATPSKTETIYQFAFHHPGDFTLMWKPRS